MTKGLTIPKLVRMMPGCGWLDRLQIVSLGAGHPEPEVTVSPDRVTFMHRWFDEVWNKETRVPSTR